MDNGVTKQQIADYLGISRTTVSLVMNNRASARISESTRQRILEASKLLGYAEPSQSGNACFILYRRAADDIRYMSMLESIEQESARFDYNVFFMSIQQNEKDFLRLSSFLDKKKTEFVLISGDLDDTIVSLLNKTDTPAFFLGPTGIKGIHSFTFDVQKITYYAARYLIERGHRKIAYFSGDLQYLFHTQELIGYRTALRDAGIVFDPALVQVSPQEDGEDLINRCEMLELDYTAILCSNTVIQYSTLMALKSRNVDVPADKSLMGIGGYNLQHLNAPQFTSCYVDNNEYVRRFLQHVFTILEKGQQTASAEIIEIPPILYEGGTVAAI